MGCDYSLIIPARNEESALTTTLSSLQETIRHDAAEIIVVDDASDVPLEAMLREYPSVVHFRCPVRQGVARARNLGASLATGKVLLFLDAHVCFSRRSLAELIESAWSSCGGLRGCTTRVVYDWPTFIELAHRHADLDPCQEPEYYGWRFEFQPWPNVVVNRQRPTLTPFVVPYAGACALAIRRALFEDLEGFDDGLVGYGSLEDAEIAMRCWSFGYDVQIVPEAVCYHYTAPRATDATLPSAERWPLDQPRYDGSLANALRVMFLHFPDNVLADVLGRLPRDPPDNVSRLSADFPASELRARNAVLEARRIRSRKWLAERMTRVG